MSEENNKKDVKMMQWAFKIKQDDDPSASFDVYEHFKDSIVDALVREAGQNSIDASRDNQKVKLKFKLGELSNAFRDEFLGGKLPTHLSMQDALDGNDKDLFEELRDTFYDDKWKAKLNYLLIEDYGTKGLAGDHMVMGKRILKPNTTEETLASKHNRFRMFHWDWGGHKGENSTFGGSWGYGKASLTLASKIKTIMTLSTKNRIPMNDETCEQILFGHCIISPHINSNGDEFRYYGHYCILENNTKLPYSSIENGNEKLNEFKKALGIERTNSLDDAGLSVLILWPQEELTFASITRSVIRNFSLAIQKDFIEFEVVDFSGKKISINADNVEKLIKNEELIKWKKNNISSKELLNLNQLVKANVEPLELSLSEPKYNVNNLIADMSDDQKLDWYQYFNDQENDEIRKVRVTVPIRVKKTGEIKHGHFDVTFMMTDEVDESKTFFQRHIIRVLGNESKSDSKFANVIALTYISNEQENCLHSFLRSAEGPSHMVWNIGRSRSQIYDIPTLILSFVTKFVPKFVEAFRSGKEDQPRALGWLQLKTRGGRKKPALPKRPKIPKILTDKSPLNASSILNGIRFKAATSTALTIGMAITIEIAYRTRKGSSFKNWEAADFLLEDLDIDSNGIDNINIRDNKFTFNVTSLDMTIDICGFDPMFERVAKNYEVKGDD